MRELTMNEMTAVFGGTEGTWGHRGRVSGEWVGSKVGGAGGGWVGAEGGSALGGHIGGFAGAKWGKMIDRRNCQCGEDCHCDPCNC